MIPVVTRVLVHNTSLSYFLFLSLDFTVIKVHFRVKTEWMPRVAQMLSNFFCLKPQTYRSIRLKHRGCPGSFMALPLEGP